MTSVVYQQVQKTYTMKKQEETITSGELKPFGFSKAFKEIIQGLDTNVQVGISSGFPALDQTIEGWEPSQLILIATDLTMDNQQLMHFITQSACKNVKTTVVTFSSGAKTNDQVLVKIQRQNTLITQRMLSLSFEKIKTRTMYLKKTQGLQLLIINALEHLTMEDREFDTREQEIEYVSGQLKALAKELSIPIIVLSKLKNQRGYCPQISDLEECVSIEYAADLILLMHHRTNRWGNYLKESGEIIIAKYCHGATTHVPVDLSIL